MISIRIIDIFWSQRTAETLNLIWQPFFVYYLLEPDMNCLLRILLIISTSILIHMPDSAWIRLNGISFNSVLSKSQNLTNVCVSIGNHDACDVIHLTQINSPPILVEAATVYNFNTTLYNE